jgi:hypothetical protein
MHDGTLIRLIRETLTKVSRELYRRPDKNSGEYVFCGKTKPSATSKIAIQAQLYMMGQYYEKYH